VLRRETRGLGLGLAVVNALAVSVGAHLEADSKPQRGTRVTVTLPDAIEATDERPDDGGPTVRVRRRNPDRVEELAGPLRVAELLEQLELDPNTVLVIDGGELVTADHELADDAEVEIRPVISGGAGPTCAVCRGAGRDRGAPPPLGVVPDALRRPRPGPDPQGDRQARGRLTTGRMFSYADRLLVAVSGGKDSLALWDALLEMGYRADGLYVGLGIGGYSQRSGEICRAFAAERAEPRGRPPARGRPRRGVRLHDPVGRSATSRSTCGVCGLSKRYVFNRVAVDEGYDVMLTGHNLDDEAATLLGNVLRWQDDFLARQRPVLPATGANQVRKCKPLYRLSSGRWPPTAWCAASTTWSRSARWWTATPATSSRRP
jgi:tRNA-5-methyluridine54 2-sulfurtransferase